jgi:hypothetical protein
MTIRNAATFVELTSRMFSHSTTTGADADWIYSGDIVFTATSDVTRIAFSGDAATGSTGPFIDNVVVRVPEPASVALVLLALSLAAAFTRRRARATSRRSLRA